MISVTCRRVVIPIYGLICLHSPSRDVEGDVPYIGSASWGTWIGRQGFGGSKPPPYEARS